MTKICRLTLVVLIFFCLTIPVLAIDSPVESSSRIAELEAKNQQLHQQLRQARRELAQIENNDQQPGWTQVFGGIGMIFGLCGVAMMFSARRKC